MILLINQQFATALEVCAGGKLYHVVVDSEETGKDILKNAKLNQRVNIIPLNRVRWHEISGQKVALAKQLVGKENVCTAISCVDYHEEVEAVGFHSSFIS
jgi:structural maintenance of chromosome 2